MKRSVFALLFLLIAIAACKSKTPKLITDEGLTAADFMMLAKQLSYPVIINDSLLEAKEKDSTHINKETFKTFLPDSSGYTKLYPKTKNLKLYLIGKLADGEKGTYVLIKSELGKERGVQLIYFNNKAQYIGSLNIAELMPKGKAARYCKIDNKHTITFVQERKTPTGELWTSETIYFMDESGKFIIAMTNNTEDLSGIIMGNPIDSLLRKQKYSADYSTDNKNLVSVRDGSTDKTFEFFIHFSKQNSDCVGEVNGTGVWMSKTKGVFRDGSSDCVISFDFTSSEVRLSEQNCGLYRNITCFFEGSYPKKREVVKKKKK